jgi:hypothetical protein
MAYEINYALIAKALLFFLFSWLSSSGKLIYYFIVTSQRLGDLDTHWVAIMKRIK